MSEALPGTGPLKGPRACLALGGAVEQGGARACANGGRRRHLICLRWHPTSGHHAEQSNTHFTKVSVYRSDTDLKAQ